MLKITNYDYKIEPLKENAGKLLEEIADKLGVPYWISAGTALGLYRDGDFIKGDTDLDFAMLGYEGVDEYIREIFEKYFLGRSKIIRTIHDDEFHKYRPMQIAFIVDGIIVDFYFHWRNGDLLENHGESGWTRMPKEICLNPLLIITKYGTLPIPREEYYEIRYGKSWRVPSNTKPIFLPQ